MLVQLGRVDSLIALVIIGREITISALREWMAKVGPAGSVAVAYRGQAQDRGADVRHPAAALPGPAAGLRQRLAGHVLIYVAAVLTLWSMGYYMRCALAGAAQAEQLKRIAGRQSQLTLPTMQLSIMAALSRAAVAQLVERNLAKVEVASSRLFCRSKKF